MDIWDEIEEIEKLFEKHDDSEYLNFKRVENKLSLRRDLHAFIMLDRLFPGIVDIVSSSEHDIIWLDVSSEDIVTLSEDQIIELIRCGVRFDEESLTILT